MNGPSFDDYLADQVEDYMRDDDEDDAPEDDTPYEDPEPCDQFWSP